MRIFVPSLAADLQFEFFRRFLRGQNYAWNNYSLSDESERSIEDIVVPLARLLFHELAHANDFLPHAQWSRVDRSLKFIDAIDSIRAHWVSDALQGQLPLNSQELIALADVRFRNATPTQEQTEVTSEYAGALLQNDGANYFYGYLTPREDLAGLFTAVMMKQHYDVDTDIAFVDKPDSEEPSCADYLVGWGVRHRLSNPTVIERTRFVVDRLLQNPAQINALLDGLSEQEVFMREGESWCANLYLDNAASGPSEDSLRSTQSVIEDAQAK